jgi:hypothetical protein
MHAQTQLVYKYICITHTLLIIKEQSTLVLGIFLGLQEKTI